MYEFKIGDKVTVHFPQSTRSEDKPTYPDGTAATIVGFSEVYHGRTNGMCAPGVYENTSLVRLKGADDQEWNESSDFLKLADTKEADLRTAAYKWKSDRFLRSLPDTPFYEQDWVQFRNRRLFRGQAYFLVKYIDFSLLAGIFYGHTSYLYANVYTIESPITGAPSVVTCVSDADIELVKRGNHYKLEHGESLEFKSVLEKAQFFHARGAYVELRNPVTGDYGWSRETALEAIRGGYAHAATPFLFPKRQDKSLVQVVQFKNKELGWRIAEHIIAVEK